MAEMISVRTGRHCTFMLHAHLVFVTKYQHRVFTDTHLRRMEEIMRAVCADFETELVEFNGEPNHVHLLVNFPPRSPCPDWSTASKASRHGGCGRSSPS